MSQQGAALQSYNNELVKCKFMIHIDINIHIHIDIIDLCFGLTSTHVVQLKKSQ